MFDTLKKKNWWFRKEVHSLKNKKESQSANEIPEKRVLCSKCDKTYSTKNDLKRHDESNCADIVTTPTQLQLNSKVGFDMQMTSDHHYHHELNDSNISAASDPISTKL